MKRKHDKSRNPQRLRGERLKEKLLLGVLIVLFCLPALSRVHAVEASDLSLVQSDDPELVNRCFLAPAKFRALEGSRIYLEGGVQPIATSSTTEAEPGPTTVTTGDARDVTSASVTRATIDSEQGELNPQLPMTEDLIYGQLLDEQGNPDGDVIVQINWVDDANKNRSFTTTTLTIEEARLMGDPLFEGYYFFSSRRIGGAEYTVTRVETTTVATEAVEQEEEEVLSAGQELNPQTYTAPEEPNALLVALGELINDYWWWVLIPVGIAFLVFLWNWQIKKFVDTILLPAAPKAADDARALLKRQAKTFMKTEWARVDIAVSAREATAVLLGTEDSFVFVEKRGELAGVLTLSDMLAALAKDEPEAIKLADLLVEPDKIELNTSFGKASVIDERILPVMKKNKIEGYVRRIDFLSLMDEYYGTHPSAARKLGSVRQMIAVPTPLMAKDSIKDAVNVAVKERTNIGVVTTKSGSGYRVIGVVPERLLVEELINFRGTVHQMNVDTVMENTRPIRVDMSALESARNVLESKHRALVVIEDDILRGVLTSHVLVNEMRGALDKII